MCAQIEPIVNGLKEQYSEQMNFEILPYNEGDAAKKIETYGFYQHGMVITDSTGKMLWGEDGHEQKAEAVEAAIKTVLEG